MNTLFDLDALDTKPVSPSVERARAATDGRWYIWILRDGERYFLHNSHDNGDTRWVRERDCGRKRPMWYKYAHTARKAMNDHQADGYGVWGGER